MKIYEAVFLGEAEATAAAHLLQHFRAGELQEDLCFALWRPGSGESRYTGVIYRAILPTPGERELHGNVAFAPRYLSRAIKLACRENAGLAFMHSHPSDGWQDMSAPDVVAERDVLASPAFATGLPLLGLTVGTDGYWSARFWQREGAEIRRHRCRKVRVVGVKNYQFYSDDRLHPPPPRRDVLRRTFDTWGAKRQANLARMKIGIVGLGSVGCIVAEAVARLGVQEVVLIDPDRVEEHNLDRLLYGKRDNIGEYKVHAAARCMAKHATAARAQVTTLPTAVQTESAYLAALDCDLLFSCVDRPVARDVLTFIAFAHLIPVIDGGVAVAAHRDDTFAAHWRAHIVTPYHQCLRCNRQYSTGDVVAELDGSLDDPSYIANLPKSQRTGNQNVFPFCLGVAGMEINLFVRYLTAQDWWPQVQQQDYQFITGAVKINNDRCNPGCLFQAERVAMGDACRPHYLVANTTDTPSLARRLISRIKNSRIFRLTKLFGIQTGTH